VIEVTGDVLLRHPDTGRQLVGREGLRDERAPKRGAHGCAPLGRGADGPNLAHWWTRYHGYAERSVLFAHTAFVAQYRFALELLDRLARDPGLAPLLNEGVPELGLPAGTYARIQVRFLNVARVSDFTALGLLAPPMNRGGEAVEP